MYEYSSLPQVIFDVAVELDVLVPAVSDDGLADVLFVVGWDRAVAAVVFVVALAVEVMYEVLLQGMGYALWHVVVHLCDAEWHADGLVVAVHGTRLCLHGRVVEVDACGDATVFRCIGDELPAEAV